MTNATHPDAALDRQREADRHELGARAAIGLANEAGEPTQAIRDRCRSARMRAGATSFVRTARCVEPEASYDTHFADGVFVVPLAVGLPGVGDAPLSLMAAMADALNFSFQGPVHPQAQLLGYLREKHMLLVLDNFEHLVHDGAEVVRMLLERAAGLTILITSRRSPS